MEPLGKNKVPFYEELKDYAWVEDYRKIMEAKERRAELVQAIIKVRELPPDLGSLMERLKISYDQYREERIRAIARMIERNRKSKHPFVRLQNVKALRLGGLFVEWAEVEAAFEYLGDENTIADEKREKELERLEAEKTALEEQIAELSPPKYFQFKDGGVVCDKREKFVQHWWGVQMWLCAACGPQKYELSASPSEEQAAYRLLGIGACISKKSKTMPFSASGYEQENYMANKEQPSNWIDRYN